MKKFFITLITLVVLFVIGCQENSVTDPIPNEAANKNQNFNTYHYGIIHLQQVLNDPYPIGNSYYIITGQIEYKHRLVFLNPIQSTTGSNVSLHLSIDAGLQYFCSVCSSPSVEALAGFISSESEENLLITGSFLLLQKSFVIQGPEDGMVLTCRFLVTTSGMELSAMWLAFQNNSVTATVNK
jgi:hypothetical protein